ncbi:glycoside hydrolase family 32 protein [Dickeya dianthicola]|uniref:GH32 C-terminal domain-containing protein n=1 Tax=Dickeya dianthicola TaxID=204039 RepID=UPI00136CA320|nr:GH32 C-terminal domain-containing protein [Dickeya dianthicola]MCI4238624.1 GH32 C-terminal domain-containing protein [Dickeya dianthicola]MCI4255444.1 GH32 C-terminal domain-containing protein [Dickeya dianthicola]MZG21836.1 glycoside hydrolase family 32 protein [Dickeya dianthicola]MZI88325.1 glycoside hydrolase family 32 protein [Dickeya dianthicola]
MRNLILPARSGMRFDLWLKKKHKQSMPLLQFSSEGKIFYAIKQAAEYYQYFTYTHYFDKLLSIAWDNEAADISLFYYWMPETLSREGVTFLIDDLQTLSQVGRGEMGVWYAREPLRPVLHFSPFINWMNDPNGLCKIDKTYHLFYQYHPHSTEWGPMHWGHAASEDLYHWRHYPVFLQPEQNLEALGATGGAFSGTAFQGCDGGIRFYFTERLPAYDLYTGYREVQKYAVPDRWLGKAESVKQVLSELPSAIGCDFRDPKVWFDSDKNGYFMLLGASVDADPAVLLFTSRNGDDWVFDHVLYRADKHFRQHGGRCMECPDFFPVGDKWILLVGIVGYTEPQTGRHNLLYALTGEFNGNQFIPDKKNFQPLDFGTDFYALQTFRDGAETLGFAWLYNWASKKTAASLYNGEMSLPRRFTLNSAGMVCMEPVPPPQSCIVEQTELQEDCLDGQLRLPADMLQSFSVRLNGEGISRLRMTLQGESNEKVELHFAENSLTLRAAGYDDGQYSVNIQYLHDLELFFDAGIVEVFANQGSHCGTRRYFHISTCEALAFEYNPSAKITSARLTKYRSVWGN